MEYLGARFDRYDPITREKMNKLRKSYIGKVRDKNIRFKAQAVDIYESVFVPAVFVPEEQWEHLHAMKLDDAIHKLRGPDAAKRIDRAIGSSSIAPGRLPDWKNWSTLLCMTEDQLRTDFERRRDLERERKQNGAGGSAAGASGKGMVNGRPNGKPAVNRLPVNGKAPVKRRLVETNGTSSQVASPRDGSATPRMPNSAGLSDPSTPTGSTPGTGFPKKKKRVVSRASDGMRVGIAVDR